MLCTLSTIKTSFPKDCFHIIVFKWLFFFDGEWGESRVLIIISVVVKCENIMAKSLIKTSSQFGESALSHHVSV